VDLAVNSRLVTRNPPPISKILIRRVCGLGDLILTLPFLRTLHRIHPKAEIHMIGHREQLDLLKEMGWISLGFSEEASNWHTLYTSGAPRGQLKPDPMRYDDVYLFVADPSASPLAAGLKRSLGDSLHSIPSQPPREARIHAALFWLSHLPLSSPEDFLIASQAVSFESPKEYQGTEEILAQREDGLLPVVVHPGSGSLRKNWPVERFARLLENVAGSFPQIRPWVLEGPADAEAVRGLLRVWPPLVPPHVIRSRSVLSLARFLDETALVVGNDSGVTHLAAALGVPTVAIFGPSDPVQWAPVGPRVRTLFRKNDCAPCHLSRETSCQLRVCVRFPEVEQVRDVIKNILDEEVIGQR
jgi:heptosyltransferase III